MITDVLADSACNCRVSHMMSYDIMSANRLPFLGIERCRCGNWACLMVKIKSMDLFKTKSTNYPFWLGNFYALHRNSHVGMHFIGCPQFRNTNSDWHRVPGITCREELHVNDIWIYLLKKYIYIYTLVLVLSRNTLVYTPDELWYIFWIKDIQQFLGHIHTAKQFAVPGWMADGTMSCRSSELPHLGW